MGKTKDVYTTISRISSYVSTAIYAILMFLFYNSNLLFVIAFVGIIEQISLLMLPVPKGSAAFKLQKIDWENKGWVVHDKGTFMTLRSPPKEETSNQTTSIQDSFVEHADT
jgi:hypothetical protein